MTLSTTPAFCILREHVTVCACRCLLFHTIYCWAGEPRQMNAPRVEFRHVVVRAGCLVLSRVEILSRIEKSWFEVLGWVEPINFWQLNICSERCRSTLCSQNSETEIILSMYRLSSKARLRIALSSFVRFPQKVTRISFLSGGIEWAITTDKIRTLEFLVKLRTIVLCSTGCHI